MCGRFTLTPTDVEFIAAGLGVPVESLPLYRPRFNIAPTDQHPIVRMKYEERVVEFAKWGLVNWWAKDNKQAARQINARADRIDTAPAFRDAFKKHRCVVPTDGFFEWTGPKTARQPHWIHRPDGQIFFFAGVYEAWQAKPNEFETTFSIVTTDANRLMEPIHNRMPVVIPADRVDEWIDPKNTDYAALKGMLVPPPEDFLVVRRVSPKLNSVKYDEAAGLQEEQPALL